MRYLTLYLGGSCTPTLLERVTGIGRKIGLNDDVGYAVAIFLALIIIASLLVGYYVLFKPAPSGYNTIYLLDSQNKAIDYPQVLIANQNSTFAVPLAVVNNMGWTVQYQVEVKITDNLGSTPVPTQSVAEYNTTLANGQTWQKSIIVTQNQVGSYWVVFELWKYNPDAGAYQFTYDYCVLPLQVLTQA